MILKINRKGQVSFELLLVVLLVLIVSASIVGYFLSNRELAIASASARANLLTQLSLFSAEDCRLNSVRSYYDSSKIRISINLSSASNVNCCSLINNQKIREAVANSLKKNSNAIVVKCT